MHYSSVGSTVGSPHRPRNTNGTVTRPTNKTTAKPLIAHAYCGVAQSTSPTSTRNSVRRIEVTTAIAMEVRIQPAINPTSFQVDMSGDDTGDRQAQLENVNDWAMNHREATTAYSRCDTSPSPRSRARRLFLTFSADSSRTISASEKISATLP